MDPQSLPRYNRIGVLPFAIYRITFKIDLNLLAGFAKGEPLVGFSHVEDPSDQRHVVPFQSPEHHRVCAYTWVDCLCLEQRQCDHFRIVGHSVH